MWALAVVEVDPGFEPLPEFGAVLELIGIDALVLERPPQALDEDIVGSPMPLAPQELWKWS